MFASRERLQAFRMNPFFEGMVLQLEGASESSGGLFETQNPRLQLQFLVHEIWGKARDSEFVMSSQAMLIVPVWGSHFESLQRPGGVQISFIWVEIEGKKIILVHFLKNF